MTQAGYIGAGVGFRRPYRGAVLAGGGAPVLEVMPDHFFTEPEALLPLAERAQLVFHDVGLSLGSEGPLDACTMDRLRRIRDLIELAPPLLFSDHLAATRSSTGLDLGHLCPLQYSRETLARVSEKVRMVQDTLGVPVALENIAAPFALPGACMREGEFFSELVAATGSGLLLDLTNLLYNGRNQGFDPLVALSDYPLTAVWQVHLAGGTVSDGFWLDNHGNDVETASFELLEALRGCPNLRCIIVERDENLPAWGPLCAQAATAHTYYCARGEASRSEA